jgi:hypothetical protein
MRRTAFLVSVLLLASGCNKQRDYWHKPKEFTQLDRRAIRRVKEMPLGRAEVLQSIAAEYTDEESPELQPCGDEDYEVRKVVRRDLRKIQGEYLEEIHVICRTATKDSSLLFFERVFDPDLERIREFNFGIDPSEFDLDD